jgi:hypothetical protein
LYFNLIDVLQRCRAYGAEVRIEPSLCSLSPKTENPESASSRRRRRKSVSIRVDPWLTSSVRVFYTGPVVNAEMLVVMLEKHGINATQEFVDSDRPDDGDLNRPTKVLVPEADYDRAHQLFYAEREDEL